MNRAGRCLENPQQTSERVDDIAQSLAALQSFLLARLLLFTLSLILRTHPNACGIEINAKQP